MNRRSFVKLLAGAAVAIATGVTTALPESSKPQAIKAPKPKELQINPAWVNAEYEASFIFGDEAFKRLHLRSFAN